MLKRVKVTAKKICDFRLFNFENMVHQMTLSFQRDELNRFSTLIQLTIIWAAGAQMTPKILNSYNLKTTAVK